MTEKPRAQVTQVPRTNRLTEAHTWHTKRRLKTSMRGVPGTAVIDQCKSATGSQDAKAPGAGIWLGSATAFAGAPPENAFLVIARLPADASLTAVHLLPDIRFG